MRSEAASGCTETTRLSASSWARSVQAACLLPSRLTPQASRLASSSEDIASGSATLLLHHPPHRPARMEGKLQGHPQPRALLECSNKGHQRNEGTQRRAKRVLDRGTKQYVCVGFPSGVAPVRVARRGRTSKPSNAVLRASTRALRVGACVCCPHKSAVRLAATPAAHRAGQLLSRAQSHPNGSTLCRGLLVACSEPTDTGCLRLMRRRGLQRPWLANGRARASVATAANSCALGCMHATARDFLWAYHKVTAICFGSFGQPLSVQKNLAPCLGRQERVIAKAERRNMRH